MRKLRVTSRIAQSPLLLHKFVATMERERRHMLEEFVQVKGLMPLLMKPCNKVRWSKENKRELMEYLRRLSNLSPYIAVVVLPGGFAVLPILAWWLDRRRVRRTVQPA